MAQNDSFFHDHMHVNDVVCGVSLFFLVTEAYLAYRETRNDDLGTLLALR